MHPERFMTIALAFVCFVGCKDEALVSSATKPIDYASQSTINTQHVQPILIGCNSSDVITRIWRRRFAADSWRIYCSSPAGAGSVTPS
jgi:hypothetical protein